MYLLQHLRKLNNFNSYLAILSALDSAPIRRLEWQKQTSEVRWLGQRCRLSLIEDDHDCIHLLCIITPPPHSSLRDWRNIAPWLTAPPPSEHTELLWRRWSLRASRTCKWLKAAVFRLIKVTATMWHSSSLFQGSHSPGLDLRPPWEPGPHRREGQLLQTLAAVQHTGQHAALPASVSPLAWI